VRQVMKTQNFPTNSDPCRFDLIRGAAAPNRQPLLVAPVEAVA
jgi:hypothetical protein